MELPALTIIQGGGTVKREESDRNLMYDESNLSNYKMVRKDDFIVHLRSFEGGLEKSLLDGIISPAYHTFHSDVADSRFYYPYFRSHEFIKHKLVPHIYGIRDGRSIDIAGMKTIEIPYTSIEEQRKIGDYLESLDHLITLHQRKYFIIYNKLITWEQRKLGDLADVTKLAGFEFTEHVVYSDEGNIIALRGLNIKNGQLILDDVKYIDGSNFSKLSRSKLFIDDIMFTYVGTVGEVAIIKENDRFYLAPNVSRIRVKSDDSPKFISNYMRTDNFKNKVIFPLIATSSQPALSMENIRKFMINMPKNRDEQDRLAEYFESLDHIITLHQRKCDDTKELKKYMLQKMFPKNGEKFPEIRFKGFTEAWEQRKLEDFGKATGGTSIESEFSEDGVYKVISIGSYSENSVYNDQGIRAIKSDKTSNRVLNRNDLTMILNDKTTSGNIIGRVLLIEESGIYVYNQRTERIEINLDEYDPVFLYEMLNAPNIREKIIKQAQGNTQIYVNWTTISLLEYMIPSKEEQVKIGEHLHGISNLIALHQRKCDTLKELKKYMLQNMFPKKG